MATKQCIKIFGLWLILVFNTYHAAGKFCGKKVPIITLDKALLTVLAPSISIELHQQSQECNQCDMILTEYIKHGSNCSVLIDTRWPVKVSLSSTENITVLQHCSNLDTSFQEGGKYNIFVTYNTRMKNMNCSQLVLMNDPIDSNIPIYVAIGIFIGAAVIWILAQKMFRSSIVHRWMCMSGAERLLDPQSYTTQDLGTPSTINPNGNMDRVDHELKPRKERLKSLDTFRGISIVVMIFVNYKGGGYWFFKHSKWNGLTIADLVFPWFVFIMGTAMAYSFSSLLRSAVPKWKIFLKILKRTLILFILGLLVSSGDSSKGVYLVDVRIPGVLQRFAGTYFIVASIHMFFAKNADPDQNVWWHRVRDILDFWPEWIIHLSLVTLHTVLTFSLKVPGCPLGYLGPGGLAEHGLHQNCTGGAAGYIDRKIFGDQHIYQHPTCKEIYSTTMPYDPEGLLGTLTSCFMCFLGLQAGKILRTYKNPKSRVIRFLCWAVILGIIATVLCEGTKNDGWIPINKNLWSLSFVIALSAMAFILLSFCYLVIDVWKFWSGAPFYFPGMNPILVYMGHEVLVGRFPVTWHVAQEHSAMLFMSSWGTAFWTVVGAVLFYRKIFIAI